MNNHSEKPLKIIEGFGDEWERFDQSKIPALEHKKLFNRYFSIFPWETLSNKSIGFDLGCGSGRWAILTAPKVKKLYCVDPSNAIEIAKKNLSKFNNCVFLKNTVQNLEIKDESMDFGYCLGVLHHLDDPFQGLSNCIKKLKKNAPFLIYLYYSFDNKPSWYKTVWYISDFFRIIISRFPFFFRYIFSQFFCILVYYPFAKFNKIINILGFDTANFPLNSYKDLSFYTMRTDSLDRLGTQLEKRFSKNEIQQMMIDSGLNNIKFSNTEPYWCALGYKINYGNLESILKKDFKISIVIPVYNNENQILYVLESINNQIHLPNEVIIIDSSLDDKTERIINNFNSLFPIIYKKINKSYPGQARNIGVKLSRYEWLAFIDSRTFPTNDWLYNSLMGLYKNKLNLSKGLCLFKAKTFFQKIVKSLTFGNKLIETLPGTIIKKSIFNNLGGFLNIRAGEDLEWFQRIIQKNEKSYISRNCNIIYQGFPNKLTELIIKWFIYSFSNSQASIIKDQKIIYLFIFVSVLIFFVFRWNYYYGYNEGQTSFLFIPHITKIIFFSFFGFYFLFRGLIKPIYVGEKLSFLLPYRWFFVGFIGILLDMVKAPGLVWGSILLLYSRLINLLTNFSKQF